MICSKSWITLGTTALASLVLFASTATAVEFTTSFGDATNAGNWNRLYAQGFKASVNPTPDPGLAFDAPVYLTRFDFFKSGLANQSATFRLAIVNNFFVELNTFTTSSPELVGLSTNAIAGTASIATGDPITFLFDNLELTYGFDDPSELDLDNYAAIFVTVNEETGALTPVLVPTLIVNYPEGPPGQFHPQANYGDVTTNYFLAASNFTNTLLVGDYNTDGKVSAADFTTWRDHLGAPGLGNRDPNNAGQVGDDDLDSWLESYGATSNQGYLVTFNPDYGDARFVAYLNDVGPGAGTSAGLATVPEPGCFGLSVVAVAVLLGIGANRRLQNLDWSA